MIDELLAYAGIDDRYADAFGNPATVSYETKLAMLQALGFEVHSDDDADRELARRRAEDSERAFAPVYVVQRERIDTLPPAVRAQLATQPEIGYYDCEGDGRSIRVIIVPSQAYVPAALDRAPAWGIAAQLYALRSERNAGIGDFGDLARLATLAKRAGAAALALNPLHQLHLSNPSAASPYAPLSRRYLNALYIDVGAAAAQYGVSLEDLDARALRARSQVDYPAVAAYKLRALERIFEALRTRRPWERRLRDDPGLRVAALYEAIMEACRAQDTSVYGWQQWPLELRDCRSAAVARFAATRAERVTFYGFIQWLADRQLAAAARAASGMTIGLYRDLAVGVDLSSADVWSDPQAFSLELCVGAPPDPLNLAGQNWGLPPLHPRTLQERGYEPFIALLRANMRHAGALRIDHVMGLRRLFCIPRSLPAGGAYMNYDFDAMLGIVALESQRARCMIVGEDLGTVPEGFRERTTAARIFSCRVLLFEREWDGAFRAPDAFASDAVASTGTHDLPTLAGYWSEADITTRERLGWESGEASERDRADRARTREQLLDALLAWGDLDPQRAAEIRASGTKISNDGLTALLVAAYRYLARVNSHLVLLQLEDGVGSFEQVNVPGTIDEEPNWRRKFAVDLDALETHPVFAAVVRALREARPQERGVG
jgi:4-alpha-glucanotransferase